MTPTAAGRRRHRWRRRHRRRHRRGARPARARSSSPWTRSCRLDGSRAAAAGRGDHRRAHRRRRRVGPGLGGLGHRRRRRRGLFADLVDEFGRLDAVVNVAGITPADRLRRGDRGRLARRCSTVHLDGYLNVLRRGAAAHGRGRARPDPRASPPGSGWRAADAGAYGCAKRAVASLTWQLGRHAPPGVTVNAHVADRRHPDGHRRPRPAPAAGRGGAGARPRRPVARAMPDARGTSARRRPPGRRRASRGAAARCSSPAAPRWRWSTPPRLLEVVRTDDVASLAAVLEAVAAGALGPGRGRPGAAAGAATPGSATVDDGRSRSAAAAAVRSCLPSSPTEPRRGGRGHRAPSAAAGSPRRDPGRRPRAGLRRAPPRWRRPSSGRRRARRRRGRPRRGARGARLGERLGAGARRARGPRRRASHADAAWARAVADHAAAADAARPPGHAHRRHHRRRPQPGPGRRPSSPGRRGAATGDRVAAFAVSARGRRRRRPGDVGELVAHLLCSPDAAGAGRAPSWWSAPDWFGLRSHPRPGGSVTFGGPAVPDWFDDALRRRGVGGLGWRPRDRRPARIVDAHVHLWDPARTDWYPYLSGAHRRSDMGDVTGMARRFDVPTYRAESAGWNVEKLVNVAAATGGHSVDETLELDAPGRGRRPPRRHRRRHPARRSRWPRRSTLLDRQMAAPRFRGVRPMGVGRPPGARARGARAPSRSGAWSSS